MKKWIDASEIHMVHELPSDIKKIDIEMRKKPNFDHYENEKRRLRKERSRKFKDKKR